MVKSMNRYQLEAIAELNAAWLKERGAKFLDVHQGDAGAYILSEDAEGYSRAEYLPVFTEMDADKWLEDNPEDHDPAFTSKEAEEQEKDLIDLHIAELNN